MNIRDSYIPNIVLIAVDNYQEKDFSGRIYTKYGEEIPFSSGIEMIFRLEDLYDKWSFPERAVNYRGFWSGRGRKPDYLLALDKKRPRRERLINNPRGGELPEVKGEIATATLICEERQHAEWKGKIQIDEDTETRDFQSVLELLRILEEEISIRAKKAGALWG